MWFRNSYEQNARVKCQADAATTTTTTTTTTKRELYIFRRKLTKKRGARTALVSEQVAWPPAPLRRPLFGGSRFRSGGQAPREARAWASSVASSTAPLKRKI
jgi:hypothetical protein